MTMEFCQGGIAFLFLGGIMTIETSIKRDFLTELISLNETINIKIREFLTIEKEESMDGTDN